MVTKSAKNLILAYPLSLILALTAYLYLPIRPPLPAPYLFLSMRETLTHLVFLSILCFVPYFFIGLIYILYINKKRIEESVKVIGLIGSATLINILILGAFIRSFEYMDYTLLDRVLFSVPLLVLLLINVSLFLSKRYWLKLTVGVFALVMLALWLCFRYMYLINKWESDRVMVMDGTVSESLESWGYRPEINLKDLMFLEHGLNKMLQEHPNPFVRNRCALMLGTREQLHNLVPLEEALSDSEFYVRLAAAFAIWKHRYPGITRRYGIGPVTEDSFLTYMNISRIP